MDRPREEWVAVDLDGTLAEHDGWQGIEHIGKPIPAMVARVLRWRAAGRIVVIFTARISDPNPHIAELAKHYVEQWCQEHLGEVLPVTNVKHREFVEMWDDRAVSVEKNTGAVTSRRSRFDEAVLREEILFDERAGSEEEVPGEEVPEAEETPRAGPREVRYFDCEHSIPLGEFCPSCAQI